MEGQVLFCIFQKQESLVYNICIAHHLHDLEKYTHYPI